MCNSYVSFASCRHTHHRTVASPFVLILLRQTEQDDKRSIYFLSDLQRNMTNFNNLSAFLPTSDMSQLAERKGFKIESTLPSTKKKNKEKKAKPKGPEHVRIIDDDAPIPWGTTKQPIAKVVEEEIISTEDAPVIVGKCLSPCCKPTLILTYLGVIDERPSDMREKERFQNMKRWRTGAFEEVPEPGSIGPQPKPQKSSSSHSSRQKRASSADSDPDVDRRSSRKDDDPSPPRRRRAPSDDPSPPRRKRDDPSPPRRKRSPVDDPSPPRRKREDASPPRRRRSPSDDRSPPRRKRDDPSPPRRRRSRSKDPSPPRRKSRFTDASSPPRRRPTKDDDDASPPRRRDRSSPSRRDRDSHSASSSSRRQPKNEPLSPPAHRRPKQESPPPPPPMQPAKSERRKLAEHKEQITERYAQWGRGLAQVRQSESAVQDYLEQMDKPLARYRDDQDLDKLLKDREREGEQHSSISFAQC